MATWIKRPDNSYFQINMIVSLYVALYSKAVEGPTADDQWYIYGVTVVGGTVRLKGPFTSQVNAQTALDTHITNLGSNV